MEGQNSHNIRFLSGVTISVFFLLYASFTYDAPHIRVVLYLRILLNFLYVFHSYGTGDFDKNLERWMMMYNAIPPSFYPHG